MRMSRRDDGNTGGEIEIAVAVDVFDHGAARLLNDEGINTGSRLREDLLVSPNPRSSARTRRMSADSRRVLCMRQPFLLRQSLGHSGHLFTRLRN
jgi:hypothetical protein